VGRGKARVYTNSDYTEMRNHEDHLSDAKNALDNNSVSVTLNK